MEVKNIIKNRRIELGLSQEEVAKHVGVSDATVSRWESGEIESMGHKKIVKLAEVLKLRPAQIMGWSDDPTPEPEHNNGMADMLEQLRRSPGRRTMFSLTKNANEETINKVNKVIEAMIGNDDDDENIP